MDKDTPWQLRYTYPLDLRDPLALFIVCTLLMVNAICLVVVVWALLTCQFC